METRFLLDTNTLIYIRRHRPATVLARFQKLSYGEAAFSVITFGELAYGAAKSVQRSEAIAHLDELRSGFP
jgi:tRNA(fMet)-specific endonuclease VapC